MVAYTLARRDGPDEEQKVNDTTILDMPKAKAGATLSIVPQHGGTIQITVRGFDPIVFDPMKASLLNRRRAEFHGWKQRLGDAAAVEADTATGRTDPAEKVRRIAALVEFYQAGGDDWSRKAGGGARAETRVDLVLQAMVNLGKARDTEHARARVEAAARKAESTFEDMVKALAKTADLSAEIARIKAANEAARNPLNADALLDGLDE